MHICEWPLQQYRSKHPFQPGDGGSSPFLDTDVYRTAVTPRVMKYTGNQHMSISIWMPGCSKTPQTSWPWFPIWCTTLKPSVPKMIYIPFSSSYFWHFHCSRSLKKASSMRLCSLKQYYIYVCGFLCIYACVCVCVHVCMYCILSITGLLGLSWHYHSKEVKFLCNTFR
jgi:hypothetical protein